MTQQLQKEMEAWKTSDQHMEDSDLQQKFDQMQGNMLELQAQNKQMQTWFGEASKKIQGLEHQAQMQQQSLSQQHQAILEVKQEVTNVVSETATTLQGALQAIKSDLLSQIQNDLGKIEAKMDKRQRME